MSKTAEGLLALANAIENGPNEIDKAFILTRVERQWIINSLRHKASVMLINNEQSLERQIEVALKSGVTT
jgi:hypothetical protein